MSIAIGFILLLCIALFHHAALTLATAATPGWLSRRRLLPVWVFGELALIHLAEIALFAAAYVALASWIWPDSFGGAFQGLWTDWLYYSGINFTTLGYTGIDVTGPLRMVSMLQSLGGFMLLTWSASYLYNACHAQWSS